ncbi:MAG: hypothetical protein ACRDNG_10610 [Gaiellaceae bacterium]
MGRVPKAAAVVAGLIAYVWVAGVHYAPGVRARKAARRAIRRS